MLRKMGRPARKSIATHVMIEEPDGEIFLFAIDNKGQSSFIGCKSMLLSKKNLKSNSNSSFNLIDEKLVAPQEKTFNNEKKIDSNHFRFQIEKIANLENNIQMKYIEMGNIDDFVNIIDSHINMDSFLKDHKLSDNMLPTFN